MLRLLSIEYLKLKYSRASKVLIIVYFGLLSSIAILSSMSFNIGPIAIRFAEQGIFEFPYIWHFTTWVAAIFKFFLLLVIVSMVSNEYSNRTLKQNLIDGLSKREFVLSKFLMVAVLSVLSTVFVGLLSLLLGFSFSSNTELSVVTTDLQYLGAFCLKLFTFFSFSSIFIDLFSLYHSACCNYAPCIFTFLFIVCISSFHFGNLAYHFHFVLGGHAIIYSSCYVVVAFFTTF